MCWIVQQHHRHPAQEERRKEMDGDSQPFNYPKQKKVTYFFLFFSADFCPGTRPIKEHQRKRIKLKKKFFVFFFFSENTYGLCKKIKRNLKMEVKKNVYSLPGAHQTVTGAHKLFYRIFLKFYCKMLPTGVSKYNFF